MEDYVINEQKKKMTLLPPGKKDNPKTIRQNKKKKNKIHNEHGQKKITNMFKPLMKTSA